MGEETQTRAKRGLTLVEQYGSKNVGWMRAVWLAMALGLAGVLVYGLGTDASAFGVTAIGLLLAGGSAMVGGLFGFLFGIPRSLRVRRAVKSGASGAPATADEAKPADDAKPAESAARYGANTNLEEISDWLTKMLVGVGLTQLTAIPGRLGDLGRYLEPALGGEPTGHVAAIAIVIYFLVSGFLFVYLWTRVFLGEVLAEADLKTQMASFQRRLERQEEQANLDARALSLTARFLEPDPNNPTPSAAELKKAVIGASPTVKVQVYYKAAALRSETWQTQKEAMERTIPIFEALVESDTDGRFHANYGQLGFALKDRRNPDFAAAERALTRAIEIRGPARENGWAFYEFNRAICRIEQDPAFGAGKPSDPATKQAMKDDLAVVAGSEIRDLLKKEPVRKWMSLNKVRLSGLK